MLEYWKDHIVSYKTILSSRLGNHSFCKIWVKIEIARDPIFFGKWYLPFCETKWCLNLLLIAIGKPVTWMEVDIFWFKTSQHWKNDELIFVRGFHYPNRYLCILLSSKYTHSDTGQPTWFLNTQGEVSFFRENKTSRLSNRGTVQCTWIYFKV